MALLLLPGIMDTRARCEECVAIAQEFGEAYADAWISGDQAFRDAWLATYNLIGGTEEDAERAEALASPAGSPRPLRINRALLRKFAHEARSGHKILLSTER